MVSEVAQFLTKVREELSAFRCEQEACAVVQQRLIEEKTELSANLGAARQLAEEVSLQAREYKMRVEQLTTQLASQNHVSREELEAERKQGAGQRSAATEKIAALEAALLRERGGYEKAVGKVRQDDASLYGNEIALLRDRLSALEQQLELERERRTRLMEVVKVHDVTVNAQKQRQPV